MGIRELLDEIKVDTLANVNRNIEEAKSKANNMIISKINELEQHYSRERLAFDNEISSIKRKLTGKIEMEIFRERQEKIAKLYNSFVEEILLTIASEIRQDKKTYLRFILNVIDNSIKELKNKEVEIIISYEDKKLASEIKKEFKNVDKISFTNILGGVILKTEDTYIDASLNFIFTKLKPEILKIILSELGE